MNVKGDGMPWSRLLAFAAVPLLGALSPLIVIPAITGTVGARAWASLAVGQGIGLFVVTLVNSGWAALGPGILATRGEVSKGAVYRASVTARVIVFLPACGLGSVLASSLVDSWRLLSALMVPAISVWAIGPVWFFTALGKPGRIALFDVGPKLFASLASAVVIALGNPAWAYPVLLGITGVGSTVVAWCSCGRGGDGLRWRAALAYLRQHAWLAASRLATGSYTSLAVPLVAVAAPSSVAAFAAADRLRSLAAVGLSSISSAFAGWVFVQGKLNRSRQRMALATLATSSLLAATVLLLSRSYIEGWLFSDTIDITFKALAAHCAALVVVGLSSSVTFHFLGPARRTGRLAAAAFAGGAVGLPCLLLLPRWTGVAGGGLGVLLAEAAVLTVLLGHGPRRRRNTS